MFKVKKKLILSTKEQTYQREHHNQVKSFSYEAIVFCAVRTRAGNLCTREYSRLFVALFSLQTTHKLYTLYTHNTWVVWSKTITKTKISQKRLIAGTQVPSSSYRTQIIRLRLNNCLLILAQMAQLKIKSTNPMPAVSILWVVAIGIESGQNLKHRQTSYTGVKTTNNNKRQQK